MAGVTHSRELTVFTNPLPNSYQRLGCDEAPAMRELEREPQPAGAILVKGDNCCRSWSSPDPACNRISGHRSGAGCRSGRHRTPYAAAGSTRTCSPGEAEGLGLKCCPPRWKRLWPSRRKATSCYSSGGAEPPLLCRGACPVRGSLQLPPTRSTSAHPLLQRHLTPAGTRVWRKGAGTYGTRTIVSAGASSTERHRRLAGRDGPCPAGRSTLQRG